MSYVVGPTFGGNYLGVRRLNTLSGLGAYYAMNGLRGMRGLGDAAQDALVQQLTAAGYDPGDIQTLIVMGATDNDLANLLNGSTDVGALMDQLAVSSSPAPVPAALAPVNVNAAPAAPSIPSGVPVAYTSVAAASAAAAQSPAGSTVVYSATWSPGYGNLTQSTANVISAMTSALVAQGLSVVSSTSGGAGLLTYKISLTLKDSVGHAQLTDITSVCNALMQQIIGANLTSGSTSLVALPGAAIPAGVPGSAANLTQWLEQNWGYLALALGLIVVVPVIARKL